MLKKRKVLIGLFMTTIIASGVANAIYYPSIDGSGSSGGGNIIKPPPTIIVPLPDAHDKNYPNKTSWRKEATEIRVRSIDNRSSVEISYHKMNENTQELEAFSFNTTVGHGSTIAHIVPGKSEFLRVRVTDQVTNEVHERKFCAYNNQLRKDEKNSDGSSSSLIPLTIQGVNLSVATYYDGFTEETFLNKNIPCWTEKTPIPIANHGIL